MTQLCTFSSFTINPDGTGANGISGPYGDTRDLPVSAQTLLATESTPILIDTVVQGTITNQQPWQTYTFEGLAGQIVTIDMTATQGSLDTLLLVLNSSGSIIADNDDVQVAVNPNSSISGLRLPTDNVYTILATRYGKDIGGTEGTYELAVSSSELPEQLATLNLPSGDIQITLNLGNRRRSSAIGTRPLRQFCLR